MKIGKVFQHPKGYPVYVTDGQYRGEYGISNFWYWNRIKKDGTLGKEECGYGIGFIPMEATVNIIVTNIRKVT